MTSSKIDPLVYSQELSDATAGGVVIFEGRVRNYNEGKNVSSLEYQSYIEMAEIVGNEILSEALKLFDIKKAYCVHREGHLAIGEMAVWVYCSSVHRAESFKACEYIINEVKQRVPIWKREHYINDEPKWVACHRCAHPDRDHHHHA